MAQRVRRDTFNAGKIAHGGPASAQLGYGLAAPVDHVSQAGVSGMPAAQMRHQAARDRNRRLPLGGLMLASAAPVEHAAIEVDPTGIRAWQPSETKQRLAPSSRVDADQDGAGDVIIAEGSCSAQQGGGFGAC